MTLQDEKDKTARITMLNALQSQLQHDLVGKRLTPATIEIAKGRVMEALDGIMQAGLISDVPRVAVLKVENDALRVYSVHDSQPPRYEHDCDKCVWLGCSDLADHWFCPSGGFGHQGSIIARFSSAGSDYTSMPIGLSTLEQEWHATLLSPLRISYEIAKQRGLVK
jgi:hypothetical protein